MQLLFRSYFYKLLEYCWFFSTPVISRIEFIAVHGAGGGGEWGAVGSHSDSKGSGMSLVCDIN